MRTRTLVLTCAAAVVLTTLSTPSAGQVAGQPYRVSDREIARLLDRIKNKTGGFRKALKDALNRTRIDRTWGEDDINAYVKDFEEETKRVRDRFNDHKSTAADVESLLDRARRIDSFVTRYPLDVRTQSAWATLRADLELLAGAYNVSWHWSGYGPSLPSLPYRVSDKEVEEIIKRIENQSDAFRKSLDSALDKSRLDGTRREDDINSFTREFYRATKELRDHFNDHKSTTNDVRTVLDRASQIDQFIRRNRLRNDREAQRDWAKLRTYLDELARVYNVTWRW